MRKHYLDNIRTICILLLFPYHTLMIWNNFGSKFYIWNGNNTILSSIIIVLSPWLMPVLFVIAGMSSRYSLIKRRTKTFIIERINKIFIPFILTLTFLVPFQTLFARKFFFDYQGGVMEHFIYFFTHFSDFNGYDGMFTFGQLWFLLYLFIISLIALLLIKVLPLKKVVKRINKANLLVIILLALPIFLTNYLGNFGGQSIGKYLLLYLLGYYLFTDEMIDKLVDDKSIILSFYIISQVLLIILFIKFNYYGDLLVNVVGWFGVLSCIIIGKLFLDKENKLSSYFKKASFPIYLLHQTILVIVGYYALKFINHIAGQFFAIILISFIVTLAVYEVIRRIPILRRALGIIVKKDGKVIRCKND